MPASNSSSPSLIQFIRTLAKQQVEIPDAAADHASAVRRGLFCLLQAFGFQLWAKVRLTATYGGVQTFSAVYTLSAAEFDRYQSLSRVDPTSRVKQPQAGVAAEQQYDIGLELDTKRLSELGYP